MKGHSFRGCLLLMLLAAVVTGRSEAQERRGTIEPAASVSPALPPGHWAFSAVRRVEAVGLSFGHLPSERVRSRDAVGALLRDASRRASEAGSSMAGLVDGWVARFTEEFPETKAVGSTVALRGASAGLSYVEDAGMLAPGFGDHVRQSATATEEIAGLAADASLAASLGSHLSVIVEPRLAGSRVVLPLWEVAAEWGGWTLSFGRLPMGYGFSAAGGLVFAEGAVLDRVEVQTARPLRIPGWLAYLGPVSFQTFLSRLAEERHAGEPFLWGASGSIQPHTRLTLSIHRGAMLGGEWSSEPITAGGLAYVLIGKHGGMENQIVSAEARFRVPSEQVLPLTIHCEWGAEDSAGAFYNVPGVVCGAFVPLIPGVPSAAAGIEYSTFGASCCGNPKWYRHSTFPGSWAAGEAALGHPLGGEGSETLLYGQVDAFDARLRVDGRAFWRERGGENLYAPEREGESTGMAGLLSFRASPRSELRFGASREVGDRWEENHLNVGIRFFF